MEWNDLRISELTRMWRAGFSASQIARQLGGVSRSAVIGKVHRLGVSSRPQPSGPRSPAARPTRVARAGASCVRRTFAAPREPVTAPAPAPVLETCATATVLTLTDSSCRWPIGDPEMSAFGFCGRARAGRGPYCERHEPLGLRRRVTGIKRREIDHIVQRYGEAPSQGISLEGSREARQMASVALGPMSGERRDRRLADQ